MYVLTGRRGVYTRKKGLDRETRKALMLKHIEDNRADGSKMDDMYQVFPGHQRSQIQNLLRTLKKEGRIHVKGRTRGGRWYPGPEPFDCSLKGSQR